MIKYLDLNTYSTSGLEFRDIPITPINEKYSINHSGLIYNKISGCWVKTSLCGVPKYHYFCATHTGKDGVKYRKTLRVHRLVAMAFVSECPVKGYVVDHIDRDRYNNHYNNLRWISRGDNQRNTDRYDKIKGGLPVEGSIHKNSKYKGVSSKRGRHNKFTVFCNRQYFGSFKNEEDAAKVYDVAARFIFEDPYLNFPKICLDEIVLSKQIPSENIIKYTNGRVVSEDIISKIKYRYKHEYLIRVDIIKKYNISKGYVDKILKGLRCKRQKLNKFSIKLQHQTDKDIKTLRWKYLATELFNDPDDSCTKKKIAEIVGAPSVRSVVKYLPVTCKRRNGLSKDIIPKVLEMYSTGDYLQTELAVIFETSKDIIGNIVRGNVR